jgi:hypothetical protein
MIMPGLSLRSWATIVSVALLMAVMRIEEGRAARARQRMRDSALQTANSRAKCDSTRRVDGLNARGADCRRFAPVRGAPGGTASAAPRRARSRAPEPTAGAVYDDRPGGIAGSDGDASRGSRDGRKLEISHDDAPASVVASGGMVASGMAAAAVDHYATASGGLSAGGSAALAGRHHSLAMVASRAAGRLRSRTTQSPGRAQRSSVRSRHLC